MYRESPLDLNYFGLVEVTSSRKLSIWNRVEFARWQIPLAVLHFEVPCDLNIMVKMLEGQYLSIFADKRKVDWPIVLLPREMPYNTITQKSDPLWCIFILLSV